MRSIVERAQDVRRNEAGMETMQSVVLTGIAALAIAGTYQYRWAIIAWVQSVLVVLFKIPM